MVYDRVVSNTFPEVTKFNAWTFQPRVASDDAKGNFAPRGDSTRSSLQKPHTQLYCRWDFRPGQGQPEA